MNQTQTAPPAWKRPSVFGALALCACFSFAGCAAPVKSSSKPTASRTRTGGRSTERSRAASVSVGSNGRAAASLLIVQGEKVEASALWGEHREELESKYKDLSPQQFRVFVADRSAQLITDKIAEVLLYQRAKLRMPEGMDKKIDEYVDSEIRKTVTAEYGGVQRRYEKALEKQGRALDAVREQFRRQIVISSFLDAEIRPKVAEPRRAELYETFRSNIDAWRKPARRSMSLIDVRIGEFLPPDVATPTREQSDAAKAEARGRIESARSELRAGATFGEVARKYSHGLHASDGGQWGWVTKEGVRERFVPAVESLAKLQAGQTGDIVETPDDYFIVRCDELQPEVEPDFESVQPELKEMYFRREYNRLIVEMVAELRKNARVEPEDLSFFHALMVQEALNSASATGG